jgi:hypothetical protein
LRIADIWRVTRFVLAGLAACWLAVAASAWRGRRRDVARHGPLRWHRAVATLRGWSPDDGGPPVAATWCRPLVQPVVVPIRELPQQRDRSTAVAADGELNASPRR